MLTGHHHWKIGVVFRAFALCYLTMVHYVIICCMSRSCKFDTSLRDVVQREFVPVNIKNDNQGAINLVKNPVKHMKFDAY